MANESESRRWNDPGWAGSWPKREQLTDGVSAYLLKAIDSRPGQRICDVGSGGGRLTMALATEVGEEGEVVGLDISEPLVDLATTRAAEAGVANVRFVRMDVQCDSLDAAPFDRAVSQFGVMFFDEPTKAFGAIRALLRPGGRLVFACWQGVEANPWHVGTALRSFLPAPPLPAPGKSPVGPFALGDDEYVCEILEAAGFGAVQSTPYSITLRAPASAVVDTSLLSFMGVGPERVDEAMALVNAHLGQFAAGPDEFDFPLAFRIFEAEAEPSPGPG
jgi:SAM-dependent methyltransferase